MIIDPTARVADGARIGKGVQIGPYCLVGPGVELQSGVRLLGQLCEPLLRPVRRVIPPIGRIDLSVLWVSIAIGALLILLR